MKKSKTVAIGLLALSIASCHKEEKRHENQWDPQTPQYYIDDGNGYQRGGISPFMVFWLLSMNRGRAVYQPAYAYQTYGGGYRSSVNGSRSILSGRSFSSMKSSATGRSMVSRGGFGSSASSHSSSAT